MGEKCPSCGDELEHPDNCYESTILNIGEIICEDCRAMEERMEDDIK